MSIAQVINIKQDKVFGENQGVWEYRSYDNEFICCTVRTKYLSNDKWEKKITPWTMQDGKWINKFHSNIKNKLIYNEHLLKIHPKKTVLIVEGEKTTDAASKLFTDYVCISWMGGAQAVKKVLLDNLVGRKIILCPDNDEPGYGAMEYLYQELRKLKCDVAFVDIKRLGLTQGWDLADLNDQHGEIDSEDIFELIQETKFNNKDLPVFYKLMDKMTFPDLSTKFNPINTSENIEELGKFYKLEIKFNMMSRKIECEADGQLFSLQNKNDCFFTYLSNLCVRNGVPKVDLHNHLIYIADKYRYHPAVEWIESKAWDRISRIKDFLKTIQSENQDLSNKIIYRWMIGCIASLYTPQGISLEGMLVVQAPQKMGKSHWFLNLVPSDKRNLIIDSESINTDDKDDVKRVTGRWICELAEIESTIKKTSIESLKAFITKSIDCYRVPFGRTDADYPRMTSFYGSVNSAEFLIDQTGNRRFWCIKASSINHDHKMNMQQVWAEFKELFDNGQSYRLTDEEQNLINEENKFFTIIDPLEQAILNAFDWTNPYRNYPMTASQVLEKLGITIAHHKINGFTRKIGSILRKLLKTEPRQSNKKLLFDMPNCIIKTNIDSIKY
jgi:putative DNA primase/helicase